LKKHSPAACRGKLHCGFGIGISPCVSLLLVLMRHAMDGLKHFEQRLPVFQQAVHQLKQFNRDEARLKEVGYSANESNYP
jgi:hypothetical protein